MRRQIITTSTLAIGLFLTGCTFTENKTTTTPSIASGNIEYSLVAKVEKNLPIDTKHTVPAVLGEKVADYALSLEKKVKYRWGGRNPKYGLDCSGLVNHAYAKVLGINVDGNAAMMFKAGEKVNKKDLVAGDLVFFNTRNRPNSHIGIYLGDGKFVHALNKKTGVRVDNLDNSYYSKRYEGARRILT